MGMSRYGWDADEWGRKGDRGGWKWLDLSRERDKRRPKTAATGTKGTRAGEMTNDGRKGDKRDEGWGGVKDG